MLALEEFNTLQQKYELETQCRFEAEKYASEVSFTLSFSRVRKLGTGQSSKIPFMNIFGALDWSVSTSVTFET